FTSHVELSSTPYVQSPSLHDALPICLRAQNLVKSLDLAAQVVPFGLEVDLRELRQTAQPQLEDVLRLHLREVEDLHQPGPCRLGVVAAAHDLDDLVDVDDRQQQPLHQVQACPTPAQPVLGAATHHLQSVVDEHLQHLLEPQGARLPVDQGHVVDPEVLLQRGVPVQLLEHGLGVVARLHG